jgi:hypothetical protein
MNAFDYLSVLISIILALGMTRVLAGVGEMLQARSHRRIYWVHAIWIVNPFPVSGCRMVDFLPLAQPAAVDIFLFIFVLISPTICIWRRCLLFPREGDVDLAVDYKTHYYANHRAFFVLFALFTPVDIVDSLLKGLPHFLGLGPLYFISGVLYFIGLTTAAITRNKRYHEFYAVFFLIQTVIISFVIFYTLV